MVVNGECFGRFTVPFNHVIYSIRFDKKKKFFPWFLLRWKIFHGKWHANKYHFYASLVPYTSTRWVRMAFMLQRKNFECSRPTTVFIRPPQRSSFRSISYVVSFAVKTQKKKKEDRNNIGSRMLLAESFLFSLLSFSLSFYLHQIKCYNIYWYNWAYLNTFDTLSLTFLFTAAREEPIQAAWMSESVLRSSSELTYFLLCLLRLRHFCVTTIA